MVRTHCLFKSPRAQLTLTVGLHWAECSSSAWEQADLPVIVYGWIGVCVFTMFVALALAELCSRWPVAGGQYSWVAVLAPPRVSRQLSYVTG